MLKNFLCHYSNLFDRLYRETVVEEGKEWRIEFIAPVMFGRVLSWLYTQQITVAGEPRISHMEAIQLWLLAELLEIPKLQDAAILYLEQSRSFRKHQDLDPAFLQYVYSATTEASLIRNYIAETWDERVQRSDATLLPQALLIDMLNARTRKAKSGDRYTPNTDTWFVQKGVPRSTIMISVPPTGPSADRQGRRRKGRRPTLTIGNRGSESTRERADRRERARAAGRVRKAQRERMAMQRPQSGLMHRITKASTTSSESIMHAW